MKLTAFQIWRLFHILWIAFVYLYLELSLYLYLHLYLYQYLYFSLQQPEFVAPLTFRIKRPHPQDESCLSWSSFGLSSKTKSMAWQRQNTPKRSKRPDNRLQVKIDFSTIDKYISPLHHHRLIAIGEQRISVCKCYNNKKCCNNKQQTIITLAYWQSHGSSSSQISIS